MPRCSCDDLPPSPPQPRNWHSPAGRHRGHQFVSHVRANNAPLRGKVQSENMKYSVFEFRSLRHYYAVELSPCVDARLRRQGSARFGCKPLDYVAWKGCFKVSRSADSLSTSGLNGRRHGIVIHCIDSISALSSQRFFVPQSLVERFISCALNPLVALMACSSHDSFKPVLALGPIGQNAIQQFKELWAVVRYRDVAELVHDNVVDCVDWRFDQPAIEQQARCG